MSYHYLLFELDLTEIGQLGNGSICFLVKSKIKKMNPMSFYDSHLQVIFRGTKQKNNNKATKLQADFGILSAKMPHISSKGNS